MDIGQIGSIVAQSEEGATAIIYQPNGEPYRGADGKNSTITALGSESKAYRAARDTITRRALRQGRRRIEPDELLKNRIDLAAACVIDWSGWESGGKSYPLTPANVRTLIAAEHILTQVEELIQEHANHFLQNSNGSSPTSGIPQS